jgi:hypothetical protein
VLWPVMEAAAGRMDWSITHSPALGVWRRWIWLPAMAIGYPSALPRVTPLGEQVILFLSVAAGDMRYIQFVQCSSKFGGGCR